MSISLFSSYEGSIPLPLTPLNRSCSDLEERVERSVNIEIKSPAKLVRYNAFLFEGDPENFENFFHARAAYRSQE